MPQQVCSLAMLKCTYGEAPVPLYVLPANRVNTNHLPAATVMDHEPLVNILPFGMCSSLENPVVAAATAAAMGALTPMPCIPATTTPWSPGIEDVKIGKLKALDDSSTCNCMWGGEISIEMPGQEQTSVS